MMNELYMDYFFWNQSIGAELIEFAKEKFNIRVYEKISVKTE